MKKKWWELKIINETIRIKVYADTFQHAKKQVEERLQRLVSTTEPRPAK